MSLGLAMSGFLGGGLGGGGAAQVGPVNTGHQVFAAHCAVGGFFDLDAQLSRPVSATGQDLVEVVVVDAKLAGNGSTFCCFHLHG